MWTLVEMDRVAKATERRWPKEKELLDKGDGLATAAVARRNDEVTSQCIYKHTGRLNHPETQSNTRTYGTKKSSYVHAYIGRDGKWRKRMQT